MFIMFHGSKEPHRPGYGPRSNQTHIGNGICRSGQGWVCLGSITDTMIENGQCTDSNSRGSEPFNVSATQMKWRCPDGFLVIQKVKGEAGNEAWRRRFNGLS